MSLKIIDRNIKSITGNISKLNDLIHSTAMLIMQHAADHGDCSRALVLVKAMPKSFRRAALIDWFYRNSPIRVNLSTDKYGLQKATDKGFTPWNLDRAAAEPFYLDREPADVGPKQTTVESFDKSFDAFVARTVKALADGNVPEDQRAAIEARLAILGALIETTDATKKTVAFVLPTPANDTITERNPLLRAAS